MPTRLKETDVVIVGLGAAGGVAALPLAHAGVDVVGLEAGAWLAKRDFSPDELRNNFRGWPQSVQKTNHEIPTHRPTASSPMSPRTAIHPMMNAVGGTTLHYWAQSWRLNPWDFKVVSETTRRYGANRVPKGSTVEDWPFGIEELEPYARQGRYGSVYPARPATSAGRSIAAATSSKVRDARVSDAAAAHAGFTDLMAAAGRTLGGTRSPGRRRSTPSAIRTVRVHVSRVLQSWRLSCRRQELDRRHDHSKAQATGRLNRHARPRHDDRVDGNGRVSGVNTT